VSTATITSRPAQAGTANGGVPARRAVIRWAWRLFRREWRQQLLVLGLLTVAVAATIWGAGVATNTPPPATATFGTATAAISLPGTDPHLAALVAQIQRRYGPVDVIENQALSTGSTQSVELRAQNPAGRFGRPLLALDSGHYPAGPGQVALTSQVASLYNLRTGSTWHADGRSWLVTGIVENPADLNDEFALAAPGQVTAPTQVTVLLNAPSGAGQNQNQITLGPPLPIFAGLPADATVSLASQSGHGGISPATVVLVVAVLGLVLIGLVSVAGFTVMAQRRLRALGMLAALGATERNVRLVMTANGAAVGLTAAVIGALLGFGAWLAYVPSLQQQGRQNNNFSGTLYVATPALLADLGLRPSQVDPGADIASMRPGLGSVPDMQLIYGDLGNPQATPSIADNPKIQQLAALPSGTSAPNTVITTHAIQQYKLQTSLDGWFIQARQPLTSAQISSARQIAANAGVTAETKSGELGLNQISDGATMLGLAIALGVLVMSVGLVRSETTGELRTLAATGASSRIRRTVTSATAGAISLLGAVLGAAGATIAGVAWARSSLGSTFGDFPVPDLLAVLAGLPLVAVVGGWLLAGRQPQVIARQPLE
jgi:hypothetical protein